MERLSDFRVRLGINIQKARESYDITQEELGGKLGVARETVRNWERGERGVRADQLYELALSLNVPSDFLLGLTKSMEKKEKIWAASDALGLTDEAIKALQGINSDDGFDESNNLDVVSQFIASEYFPILIASIAMVVTSVKNLRKPIKADTRVNVLKELHGRIRAAKHALYDSVDSFRDVLNDIVLSEIGHGTTADTAIFEAETVFREDKAMLSDGEREEFVTWLTSQN